MSIKMKIAKKVKTYVHHKWYLFYSSIVVFLDFFVPLFPSTTLVIASSMLRPKNWLAIAILYTLATVVGGVIFLSIVEMIGEALFGLLFPQLLDLDTQSGFTGFIYQYGAIGLGLLALTPIPIRTVSIIAILLNVPLSSVMIAILGGRLLLYLVLALLSSRFPSWLFRFNSVNRSPFLNEIFSSTREKHEAS